MILVDHIFVFSNRQGKEADELLEFGLKESEGRSHSGQGTVNRKFHFGDFFLEVLWVENQAEIESDLISKTGLNKRANFRENGLSPFGLCLVNTSNTDPIFKHSYSYQPDYFPPGFGIDILMNEDNPSLPWLFRLPLRKEPDEEQHFNYQSSLGTITNFDFGISEKDLYSNVIGSIPNGSLLSFSQSNSPHLILSFGIKRSKSHTFKNLPITLKY